jgi:hypothetical protein
VQNARLSLSGSATEPEPGLPIATGIFCRMLRVRPKEVQLERSLFFTASSVRYPTYKLARGSRRWAQGIPALGNWVGALIEDLAERHTPSTLEAYRSLKSHGLRSKKRGETMQGVKTRTDKSVSHQRGSANVADLGYKSHDEMLVKAQLVTTIAEILAERGYIQTKAAVP